MQKVAFFDIDGTIFRSSLLIELTEACIQERIFPRVARDMYQKELEAWQNREGTYDEYIGAVINSYLAHIKGVFYGDFADVGRKVVAEHAKHTYRYTRDLVADLGAQGYYLVAISQSPKTILDEFCTTLGFHKVYGRMYEIGPRDLFTGEIADLDFIQDKSLVVERVFSRGGFSREGSIGVGDTEGDIPLLQSVETPICFNPNMALYTHAKKSGWPVVVERKDVIYTI